MIRNECFMTTYTGKKFNPLDPDPEMICIEDIAHHLALECRYNGACKFFYSVAQHSVLGLRHVSEGNAAAFLLHDGAEAYLRDIVKGVKDQLRDYKRIESHLQAIIYERFGIMGFYKSEVKRVDYALMATEARVLIGNLDGWSFPELPLDVVIEEWSWRNAEDKFLQAAHLYSLR